MVRRQRSNTGTTALLIFIMTVLVLASPSVAQFGIPKAPQTHEVQEDTPEEQAGFLSPQDAADMEAIIAEASKDPETIQMVQKMKGEMAEEIAHLKKLSQEEVLGGMKQTMENLKQMDYLFKDKERALKEMEKDGMIDKNKLKTYKKNPELLEQDTRKGLYFQFVALAVVGGFM